MHTSYKHIDILDQNELHKLIAEQQGPCVSLYLPIPEHGGVELTAEPLRLKRLLEQAAERLAGRGLRTAEIQELLAPATKLVEGNMPFWQHQSDGLALFLTRSGALSYRLPLLFEEQVVVDQRFYLRPLLPLLSGDGLVYILALSQNHVRLLRASRYTVGEVSLEKIPHSLAEAMQYDQVEPSRQVHSAASSGTGGGRRAVTFHGQGTAADESLVKGSIHQYLQQVEQGVTARLADQQAPLILAGVDYLCHMYRQVNQYRHLHPENVATSPDRLSAVQLQAKAWPLVAPLFQQAADAALTRYTEWAGQGSAQAVQGVSAVVRAAFEGRVEALFLATASQAWGSFDPATGEVLVNPDGKANGEELLNLAVVYTLRNSGVVYAVEPQALTDQAAALLRF
jgi:hypothetical protein